MHERDPSIHATRDPRAWAPILACYREPNCARSTVELVITAVPFVVLWVLMSAALGTGYWVGLLLAVPAAGFLVRLFMIQHDCGHGLFFRRRRANDWVGRVIGVLTLTPRANTFRTGLDFDHFIERLAIPTCEGIGQRRSAACHDTPPLPRSC